MFSEGVRFLTFTWFLVWMLFQTSGVQGEEKSESLRNAYFGDLHIHTMYSLDAFMSMGALRTGPDAAYRYAKGEAIQHPSGQKIRLTGPPLDFLAVSDHAMYLGSFTALLDPSSDNFNHPLKQAVLNSRGINDFFKVMGAQMNWQNFLDRTATFSSDKIIKDTWRKEIEAAERHNEPGTFTTFVGYEYTPTPDARHLHRNVIFKSSDVPDMPFSSVDSGDPEDLWDWMDGIRAEGTEVMAIPHNMNQSDGLAFMESTWRGEPVDRMFAEKRIRNEPIAEISQIKGTSETHPSLSPNDEWADFQIVQYYLNRVENKDPISVFKGGYWRDALNTGLELEEKLGVNPFQLGAIGSSDNHSSAGSYEEDKLHSSNRNNRPQGRGSAPRNLSEEDKAGEDIWKGFVTPRSATHGTGGLAGVWAEENTRSSLFEAMQRRETFGTSGPRIAVRLFGSFDFNEDVLEEPDLVSTAYRLGVPMGGVLSESKGSSPKLLAWAARDPNSGWLQRVQIVKGWLEEGESKERVYDVVCSDGLAVDTQSHRCPDNDATVNLNDCSISRDLGAVELVTLWEDPDFNEGVRAYYYARVLENPSCRWSTWDAIRLGIKPNPDLPASHQERAWSSPIWYNPS